MSATVSSSPPAALAETSASVPAPILVSPALRVVPSETAPGAVTSIRAPLSIPLAVTLAARSEALPPAVSVPAAIVAPSSVSVVPARELPSCSAPGVVTARLVPASIVPPATLVAAMVVAPVEVRPPNVNAPEPMVSPAPEAAVPSVVAPLLVRVMPCPDCSRVAVMVGPLSASVVLAVAVPSPIAPGERTSSAVPAAMSPPAMLAALIVVAPIEVSDVKASGPAAMVRPAPEVALPSVVAPVLASAMAPPERKVVAAMVAPSIESVVPAIALVPTTALVASIAMLPPATSAPNAARSPLSAMSPTCAVLPSETSPLAAKSTSLPPRLALPTTMSPSAAIAASAPSWSVVTVKLPGILSNASRGPPVWPKPVSWPAAVIRLAVMLLPTVRPMSPSEISVPLPVSDSPAARSRVPPSSVAPPVSAMSPSCDCSTIAPLETMDSDAAPPKLSVSRVVIATLPPAMLPVPRKRTGASSPCPIRTWPSAVTLPRQISPARHGAASWPLSLLCAAPEAGGLRTSANTAEPEMLAPRVSIAPPISWTAPTVPSMLAPLPAIRLATLPGTGSSSTVTPPASRNSEPGSAPASLLAVSDAPLPITMSSPEASESPNPVVISAPEVTVTSPPASADRLLATTIRPPPPASPSVRSRLR